MKILVVDDEALLVKGIRFNLQNEGYDVIKPEYFPTFVYVTVLKEKDYDFIDEIESDDLITIGIGELYATYENAKNHIFDK